MEKYRYKRIFVIVADSMGSGYMKDAARFGDEGANTLLHIGQNMPNGLNVPVLNSLGLGDLDPINGTSKVSHPNSFIVKYFIASQFHPEFKSRPTAPHPLFNGLVKAALKKGSAV